MKGRKSSKTTAIFCWSAAMTFLFLVSVWIGMAKSGNKLSLKEMDRDSQKGEWTSMCLRPEAFIHAAVDRSVEHTATCCQICPKGTCWKKKPAFSFLFMRPFEKPTSKKRLALQGKVVPTMKVVPLLLMPNSSFCRNTWTGFCQEEPHRVTWLFISLSRSRRCPEDGDVQTNH